MKKTIIGGILLVTGCAAALPVYFHIQSYPVGSWSTPPGLFLTSAIKSGMLPPLVFAVLLIAAGLAALAIEYFRKEN